MNFDINYYNLLLEFTQSFLRDLIIQRLIIIKIIVICPSSSRIVFSNCKLYYVSVFSVEDRIYFYRYRLMASQK